MSENAELVAVAREVALPNYRPPPFVLREGQGVWVEDVEGRRFLDFTGGIAVASVGHAHPRLAAAIAEQAGRLIHTSNLFYNQPAIELARELVARTPFDCVYFSNSGAEANETLLKLARRWHHEHGRPERFEMVTAERSFHGRTMGALSLTGQPKYHVGMGPMVGGIRHVPFGDVDALAAAVGPRTAAILLEPMQGEGGLVLPPEGYLQAARRIADEAGALLFFDEVQTGIGRTGRFLAWEHSGVEADACALAKGIGGGFPLGAVLIKEHLADGLPPGSHASTFGGGPLACAAGRAVLAILDEENAIDNARVKGEYLGAGLQKLADDPAVPAAIEARGLGLLRGIRLAPGVDAMAVLRRLRDEAELLVTVAGGDVIRLAPSLLVTREEVDDALARLGRVLREVEVLPPEPALASAQDAPLLRHFRTLLDLGPDELEALLDRADELARLRGRPEHPRPLEGKSVVILLEKASTRTRVSFEVGIAELGGNAITLLAKDTQLGRGEPIEDTARMLSRYAHAVVYRTFGHERVEALAAHGTIPIINGLSDLYHPCQLLADLQTVRANKGALRGLKVAWVGDGNNMAHSWIFSAALTGLELRLACPKGYWPDEGVVDRARTLGAKLVLTLDPREAVAGADVVTTDVWASMGQEDEDAARREAFAGFAVDRRLMALADPDAIFLHCLPAHRGEEVEAEVIDGLASRVWDEAENRLHAQKALLEHLLT